MLCQEDDDLSAGEITGIAIGCIVVVAIICVVTIFVYKKVI